MPFILCLFTFFLCCHKDEHNDAHFDKSPSVAVTDKRNLYCEKTKADFIAKKWAVDECDGLLFAMLRIAGCGLDIPIETYEDSVEPGKWYRDPAHRCYLASVEGEQGSDSSISKDMYLGLMAGALSIKSEDNKNILGRTIDYGKSHDWIVGEAKDNVTLLSKCFITPTLQGMLKDALNYQGGALTDVTPADSDAIGVSSGFRAHLDVLAILVRGKISGHISALDLNTLKDQAKRQPNNALFQAAKARYDDGDFSQATALLLDVNHWPENSLPNNHDNHCSNYLYQRDEEPDNWAPCPDRQFKEFDGTDYIFAAAIVEGRF